MIILKIIFSILICIPFGYLLYRLFDKMMEMLNGFSPKQKKKSRVHDDDILVNPKRRYK